MFCFATPLSMSLVGNVFVCLFACVLAGEITALHVKDNNMETK